MGGVRRRAIRWMAAAVACLGASTLAQADIRIGTAGPFSGQYANLGKQIQTGAARAVADLNAGGGVNGEPLVLEIADDGCDAVKAADAAQTLIAKGIVFMAGHYCSFASLPAGKLYAEANVVMISPAATHPRLTDEGGWNVNRIVARDDAQGSLAGQYLARQYAGQKIAVLDDGTPYGKGLADKARAAMAEAGQTPAVSESYAQGTKDFAELIARLQQAAVAVVYIGGGYGEAGRLIRQMRELGLEAAMVGGDALVTDDFWSIAGDSGEGTLATFAADPQKFDTARTLVAQIKAEGGNPEGYAVYAYAAVQAWAQAAVATGGTDGKAISDWLRAGNVVHTVVGDVSFDAKGDVREPHFVWFRWSAGQYTEDTAIGRP